MALNRQLCVPQPRGCCGSGAGYPRAPAATAQSRPPFSRPVSPRAQSGSPMPNLGRSRAGTPADPTPHVGSWAPRSLGGCAGTSQVGRPAHPPGNRLPACPAHLAGHTPLLTQRPACRRGQRGWGGGGDRRRRSALGSQVSIRDKGLCWAAAKPWRTKGPEGG